MVEVKISLLLKNKRLILFYSFTIYGDLKKKKKVHEDLIKIKLSIIMLSTQLTKQSLSCGTHNRVC